MYRNELFEARFNEVREDFRRASGWSYGHQPTALRTLIRRIAAR